jgi:hypothetical protein
MRTQPDECNTRDPCVQPPSWTFIGVLSTPCVIAGHHRRDKFPKSDHIQLHPDRSASRSACYRDCSFLGSHHSGSIDRRGVATAGVSLRSTLQSCDLAMRALRRSRVRTTRGDLRRAIVFMSLEASARSATASASATRVPLLPPPSPGPRLPSHFDRSGSESGTSIAPLSSRCAGASSCSRS